MSSTWLGSAMARASPRARLQSPPGQESLRIRVGGAVHFRATASQRFPTVARVQSIKQLGSEAEFQLLLFLTHRDIGCQCQGNEHDVHRELFLPLSTSLVTVRSSELLDTKTCRVLCPRDMNLEYRLLRNDVGPLPARVVQLMGPSERFVRSFFADDLSDDPPPIPISWDWDRIFAHTQAQLMRQQSAGFGGSSLAEHGDLLKRTLELGDLGAAVQRQLSSPFRSGIKPHQPVLRKFYRIFRGPLPGSGVLRRDEHAGVGARPEIPAGGCMDVEDAGQWHDEESWTVPLAFMQTRPATQQPQSPATDDRPVVTGDFGTKELHLQSLRYLQEKLQQPPSRPQLQLSQGHLSHKGSPSPSTHPTVDEENDDGFLDMFAGSDWNMLSGEDLLHSVAGPSSSAVSSVTSTNNGDLGTIRVSDAPAPVPSVLAPPVSHATCAASLVSPPPPKDFGGVGPLTASKPLTREKMTPVGATSPVLPAVGVQLCTDGAPREPSPAPEIASPVGRPTTHGPQPSPRQPPPQLQSEQVYQQEDEGLVSLCDLCNFSAELETSEHDPSSSSMPTCTEPPVDDDASATQAEVDTQPRLNANNTDTEWHQPMRLQDLLSPLDRAWQVVAAEDDSQEQLSQDPQPPQLRVLTQSSLGCTASPPTLRSAASLSGLFAADQPTQPPHLQSALNTTAPLSSPAQPDSENRSPNTMGAAPGLKEFAPAKHAADLQLILQPSSSPPRQQRRKAAVRAQSTLETVLRPRTATKRRKLGLGAQQPCDPEGEPQQQQSPEQPTPLQPCPQVACEPITHTPPWEYLCLMESDGDLEKGLVGETPEDTEE